MYYNFFDNMSVLKMEALRKMIELSEDAISKGQVMNSEQLRAKHPRVKYNENIYLQS